MPYEPVRWPMFRRVWRQAALFDRMAQELRVEISEAIRDDDGEAVRKARSRCLECTHGSECSEWLEAATGLPLPPSFCPNTDWLEQCMQQAQRADGGTAAGRRHGNGPGNASAGTISQRLA